MRTSQANCMLNQWAAANEAFAEYGSWYVVKMRLVPRRIKPTQQVDVVAFGGIVAAATVWALSGDLFPPDPDPKGDPESWTREEMRRWLEAVSLRPFVIVKRPNLLLIALLLAKPFPSSERFQRGTACQDTSESEDHTRIIRQGRYRRTATNRCSTREYQRQRQERDSSAT